MRSERATACIAALGSDAYHRAAAGAVRSVLAHTDWDVVLVSDRPVRPVDPRVTAIAIDRVDADDRAQRFLAKFRALERALALIDTPLVVLLDADARLVRATTGADVAAALDGRGLGMVEQAGIRGSDMTRASFLAHYRDHSLRFIAPDAEPPALDAFRYYNSGVVLARRDALVAVVADALARIAAASGPHAVGSHMIADQDYFQHWALTLHPGSCADLGWEWNHCAWWHDPFPRAGARVLHFSSFTDGPTPATLAEMDAVCARVEAGGQQAATVTAVVVTHRSAARIGACIRALRLAGVERVVVVDNASDDDTVARAEAAGGDVVELPRNHGFAVAANAGASLAPGGIICFANPDCLVDAQTVRRGVELCADERVCAVPDFEDDAGRVTTGVRGAYSRRRLLGDLAGSAPIGLALARTPRLDGARWAWPIGACVFVAAGPFAALGGFDERYFLYMEDVDFGRRWCAAGGRVRSTGTAVRHAEQAGAAIEPAARGRLLRDARVRYARHAFGPLTGAAARLVAGAAP